MTDPLVTRQAAAQLLGIQEGEIAAAVESGDVREVFHRASPEAALESFIVGADIDRLLSGSNSAMNRAIRAKVATRQRQPGESVNDHFRRRAAR